MSKPSTPAADLSGYRRDGRFVKRRDFRLDPGYQWRPIPRWRKSKARRELDCYKELRKLGVPVPEGVEIAEERNALGMLTWCEISMPFLENTADLRFLCLLPEHEGIRTDPRWRRGLIAEVARLTRLMHTQDYFAQNLHFRNWLVELGSDPEQPRVLLIDCVSGKYARGGWKRRHLLLKDLGFLYRDGRYHCSLKERLRFMHIYLGRKKLTASDKALMAAVVAYVEKKWGDKQSTV